VNQAAPTATYDVGFIGLGYVGFPAAAAAAAAGHRVIGYDVDADKLAAMARGVAPDYDPRATAQFAVTPFAASGDPAVLAGCPIVVVCVPTPVDEKKRPDFGPVLAALDAYASVAAPNSLLIIESTINPGVCDEIAIPRLAEHGLQVGRDYEIVHCPERVNPGDPVWHVGNIARNVGGSSMAAAERARAFYASFIDATINVVSSLRAAEATKVVENTFRDINIAFVNELAKSFDRLDLDVTEVLKAASNKPFGFMPHLPGCGVGGHCIPVDPYYLIEGARSKGFLHRFLIEAREVNESMPEYTVERVVQVLNARKRALHGTRIALLGLSYKPGVGDLRESPALVIRQKLLDGGADVLVCDPYLDQRKHGLQPIDEVLATCDIAVIACAHPEFVSRRDWGGITALVDGRNCIDASVLPADIDYLGIGRRR
jgi:UDP-N-acetyl-D-glucosamine dehydrogenase